MDNAALNLHMHTLAGTHFMTTLRFQCLFMSDCPVDNRVLFISSVPLLDLTVINVCDFQSLLNEGYMGYYKFEREEQSHVLCCLNHFAAIFCKPAPDRMIYRQRRLNQLRFMVIFSGKNLRNVFEKLSTMPRAVCIDTSDFGSVFSEYVFGRFDEYGIEEYRTLESGLKRLETGPCDIVITKQGSAAVETEDTFNSAVRKATIGRIPAPTVVAYVRAFREVPFADAAFTQSRWLHDFEMKVYLYAYVLSLNRESLNWALGATSF